MPSLQPTAKPPCSWRSYAPISRRCTVPDSVMRGVTIGILVFTGLTLSACSGGLKEGTPAFYWAAAQENFAIADYVKTVQHLERLSTSDSEFSARARPWLLVMTSGMAQGYMDLADSFEAGSGATKSRSGEFRRRTNNYRVEADHLALEFLETFDRFQKGTDDPVPIALPFPKGSASPVEQLSRVAAGSMPEPGDIELAEKAAIRRRVLLAACNAAGAPDDPTKTQELMKPGNFTVPRSAFVILMADTLFQQSQLYNPRKRADPDKFKLFGNRAMEALKTVPETKQTKDLSTKIAKNLKKTLSETLGDQPMQATRK